LVTCSIHASEVGAAQMSMELTHKLLTEDTDIVQTILDNVIFLLVPSFNPDGLIIVKDWYDKYLETPFEASSMPWLYHTYTGHDNNRDAYMLTQVESKLINKVLYKDWLPQVYLDEHQMGNTSMRLFVPPFIDPINPNVDPLIWRGNAVFGVSMSNYLESKGYSGVGNSAFYTGWWEGGFLMTAWFHNVIGLLTEAASVRIASPIFQNKSDLRGGRRGLPEYREYANFPNPWPGGWWRLRSIVNYELTASISFLETAAKFRESILFNYYQMGKSGVERGKKEPPYSYLVPENQFDPATSLKMLDVLMEGGVEVHQALADFSADNIRYPKGTYVILMSQPYRAYAKDMLERQAYPELRQYEGGPPIRPYDITGWTLPLQMGVKVVEVIESFDAELIKLDNIRVPEANVSTEGEYLVLDYRTANAVKLINRLLKKKYKVYFSDEPIDIDGKKFPKGTIVIPKQLDLRSVISASARELSVDVYVTDKITEMKGYAVKPVRLGVYQPWLASMDEGWSRWLIEQFEFDYVNIHNPELRTGGLKERYDVIYLPDIRAEGIFRGHEKGSVPPEYAEGIKQEGVTNLKTFVEDGGVLVTINASSELVIGNFGLPVVNVLKDVKPEDFFCPGSILRISVDNDKFLGFGMNPSSSAFFASSPAYRLIPSFKTESKVIAKYPEKNILRSGWLMGEEKISNRAAVVDIPVGKGHVVLIGFEAVQRVQSYNTFKLLFNAFYLGTAELTDVQ
ncbi:M14 family metallopeptidase, partial [candidate division KSB1 bacterium]